MENAVLKDQAAKTKSDIYMVIGFVLSIVFWIVGNRFATFIFGVIYPILGVVLMLSSGRQIKFMIDKTKSTSVGISVGFYWPVMLIAYNALMKYELLSHSNLLPASGAFALLLFVLLISTGIDKLAGRVPVQILTMLVLSAFWGWGTATAANCMLDTSPAVKYQTTVADHYTTNGRGTSYHLVLASWKPGQKNAAVTVKEKFYLQYLNGGDVSIVERQGLFDMAWFDYELHPAPKAVK